MDYGDCVALVVFLMDIWMYEYDGKNCITKNAGTPSKQRMAYNFDYIYLSMSRGELDLAVSKGRMRDDWERNAGN